MTHIFGSGLAPKDRSEDTAALQRRLLQGLERQWLELWGQAHQVQAQTRATSEDGASIAQSASGNSPKTLEAESVMGVSAEPTQLEAPSGSKPLIAAPERMAGESAAQLDGAGGDGQFKESRFSGIAAKPSPAGSLNGVAAPTERVAVNEAVRSHKVTAFDPASAQEAVSRGIASRAKGQVLNQVLNQVSDPKTAANGQATTLPVASRQLAAGRREPSFGSDRVGAALPMAIVPVWRDGEVTHSEPSDRVGENAQTFSKLGSPQDAVALSSLPRVALPLTATAVRSPAARVAAEESVAGSKAVPRRFASTSPDPEPTTQHLMLREVDEQAVLASMRHAHLSSHESQLVAQELARALMQAGYARVQVVVNGHQQRLGEPVTEDGLAYETGSPAEPSTSTTKDIQAVQHGN